MIRKLFVTLFAMGLLATAAYAVGGPSFNGDLTVNGNETVNGDLAVTGSSTVNTNQTVNGNAVVNGDLTVTGTLNATIPMPTLPRTAKVLPFIGPNSSASALGLVQGDFFMAAECDIPNYQFGIAIRSCIGYVRSLVPGDLGGSTFIQGFGLNSNEVPHQYQHIWGESPIQN